MNEIMQNGAEICDIRPLICELRGQAVMLDRDLAELYHVMTGRLNEAVKRNLARFPPEFMFQLSDEEMKELVANCDRFKVMKHSPSRMYAFTEQGVAMLSAVLKSDIAIRESIRIMKAFVVMRRLLSASVGPTLASLASRVEANERRQIEDQAKNERRFEEIHAKMSAGEIPLSHIFYDGQLWDARALVLRLVSGAKKSLVLIDNWVTVETLDLFAKKRKGVNVTVITSEHIKKGVVHHTISDSDVATFNAQYPKLAVRYNETFHDRFLIVDDKELYLIGASLKDLGKKCFGFTKMDAGEIARIKKATFGAMAVKKGAK